MHEKKTEKGGRATQTHVIGEITLPSIQGTIKSLFGNSSSWFLGTEARVEELLWKAVYVFVLCVLPSIVIAVIDAGLIGMWVLKEKKSLIWSIHYLDDLLKSS